MRTSTIVMIGFAVAFGLLAVFLANAWLNNRAAEQMRNLAAQHKAAPPTHTIVVASHNLKFGDVLGAFSLRELPWPDDALPAGAFAKIGELTAAKHVVLRPIEVNEPILKDMITPGSRATLSMVLHDNMKAVTIRVTDVEDVAGFVLPGDRVDVVLTRPGDKITVNDVLVQNAIVLAVDQTADQTVEKPTVVRAVTLEVNEADGQKLALASRIGTLSLLLREAGDVAKDRARRMTPTDLRLENGEFASVLVTRPTKDAVTQEEFSVPVEHGDVPAAALSGQATARE